ncbi:segregation/condensation protein A [Methanothermococcus okinawensis]|uniref:Chromosome segregation and condensation protein ScpA n=1 Tax=Methanothermococcus okinawensis (strain DSM 14208 / JCM 11175 / IH1) TaxID=647113 RepID=F8ALE7_METOI|nr:segregation/condensation protein A [Methanothermococcus okinawensis]AEH06535.1 chromosome segregation and condensation protein ScpA [Methanothermococcus okinawensis IH1]
MEFELWIKIIKESIDKRNIEPWNINIAEITNEYIKTIKELKKFDIRLSADVILVGGILLRMKSQILYGECENTFNEEDEEFEDMIGDELQGHEDEYVNTEYIEYNDNNIENIANNIKENENKNINKNKNNNIGSKQITFNDLINTLKSELKKVKKTRKKQKNKEGTPIYNIIEEMEEEYDISDLMENLISELEKEGEFVFQNKFYEKKEVVKNFLPSLYLANDGKIEIFQEELFKDILLRYKN